jgi:hypothetical protein
MQDAAPLPGECEAIAAAGRLIVNAIDGMTGLVTEQQRADGTVANEENVARAIAG